MIPRVRPRTFSFLKQGPLAAFFDHEAVGVGSLEGGVGVGGGHVGLAGDVSAAVWTGAQTAKGVDDLGLSGVGPLFGGVIDDGGASLRLCDLLYSGVVYLGAHVEGVTGRPGALGGVGDELPAVAGGCLRL